MKRLEGGRVMVQPVAQPGRDLLPEFRGGDATGFGVVGEEGAFHQRLMNRNSS